MSLHEQFIAALRAESERRGFTSQQQLADAIERTQQYVARILSGHQVPTLKQADMLLAKLGLEPKTVYSPVKRGRKKSLEK